MNERPPLRTSVGVLAVALVALLLFTTSLQNGFAYDDVPIVQGDARIRSVSSVVAIFTGGYWSQSDLALYRPLTTLSFALDWSLAPDSPAWFHFSNVWLHALASALAFLLLARLFPPAAALAGGLIFAVHPVHVEAVANVVGRAELLSSVLTFAAGLVWLGTAQEAQPRSRAQCTLVGVLLLAALLSKEGAIMAPALLVLLDAATGRLDLRRPLRWLNANRTAVLALAIPVIVYLGLRYAALGAFAPTRLDPLLEVATSTRERMLTALQAWPWYLRLHVFPVTLLADYGPRMILPAASWTPAAVTGLIVLVSLLAGGAIAFAKGHRRFGFALFWFPLAVLPVSNLIVPIGVLVAERTLYLPSFALSVGVCGLAAAAMRAPARLRTAATAVLATVCLLMTVRTLARIPDWRSTDSVMVALVRDRPDSFRGHWHLARMARVREDVAQAAAEYELAMQLWPYRKRLAIEAGAWLATARMLPRAANVTAWAARQWPDDVEIQRMRAGIALDLRDTVTAREAVSAGLRLRPDDEMLRRMAAALDSMTVRLPDRP